MDQTHEILKEARTLLGHSGDLWVKHGSHRSGQPSPYHKCILTAIWDTIDNQPAKWKGDPMEEFLAARARFCSKNGIMDIPVWNDYPSRTFADVDHSFRVALNEVL